MYLANKHDKAEKMRLFWTPSKRRWASKASPRRKARRKKRKRQAKINMVDNIKELTGLNYAEAIREAQCREDWTSVTANLLRAEGT